MTSTFRCALAVDRKLSLAFYPSADRAFVERLVDRPVGLEADTMGVAGRANGSAAISAASLAAMLAWAATLKWM